MSNTSNTPTPPDKPSLEEQITDWVYKILMAGGIGFGGLGAFWQLFKQSDIPKAIVSAVIGAGVSYGAAMLQPIHKGNQKRFEQFGEEVNQEVDELTTSWMTRWTSSDFEGKYLICQQLDCHEDDPVGVLEDEDLPLHHPLLQDIFVPLELSTDSTGLRGYSEDELRSLQKQINEESMQIWQLLKCAKTDDRLRQISIRASGGYGKTTLLKHLAYIYSIRNYNDPKYKAPKFIPFLIYLASCYKEISSETSLTLPDLLSNFHISRLPKGKELKVPPNWAKNLLNTGEALVLWDGFDEIPPAQREKASQWLSGQMKEYPKAVFILTSRPAAYQEDYTARKLTANFWIKDFNEDQRKAFVEQWYSCQERRVRDNRSTPDVEHKVQERSASLLAQIEARPELKQLAGNPLLLNMMARFHRNSRKGAELPDRKVELYQDICELQLSRRPKAKGLDYLLLRNINERQTVLQNVALVMMQRATIAPEDQADPEGFKQITERDLLQLIQTALQPFDPTIDAKEFLKQIVQVSELLVHKDGRTDRIYQFSHLTFQEFLAANELVRLQLELARQQKLASTQPIEQSQPIAPDIEKNLHLSPWKDLILFYAALINPRAVMVLIQTTIDRNFGDLAYAIYRQTDRSAHLSQTERKALQSLKNSVLLAWVQPLETYLKNQQWREADEETYRLMITAVGKENGQLFSEDDLRNFPCEELLMIDRLWVQHSNGLYGFSVQKEIYVKCAGKLDFSYPSQKTWNDFCHQIRWQKGGEYLFSEIYKKEHMNYKGHLPFGMWVVFLVRGVRLGCVYFFSRIKTCEV